MRFVFSALKNSTGLVPVVNSAVNPSLNFWDPFFRDSSLGSLISVPSRIFSLSVVPGESENTLTWSAPANNGSAITDYVVEVDTGAGFSVVNDGVGTLTTFTHVGLINGLTYNYRVSSINNIGTSTPSVVSSGTPVDVPESPDQVTGLLVTSGDTQNTLNWNEPQNNGAPIADYVIEVDSGSGFSVISDGTNNNTSFVHTGLTNGTVYTYRVSAVNTVGAGAASTTVSGTPADVPESPDQVTGLLVTSGNTQNTLNWNAPQNNGAPITDYVIEVDSGSGFSVISDGTNNNTSFIHTGLTNGTVYTYRVSAVNTVGTGAASTTVSQSPQPESPDQVTGLLVTSGDTQNTLNWNEPQNNGAPITDYVIEVDSGSGFSVVVDGTNNNTSFVHTGLTNGTVYTYRVSAVNTVGTGVPSSTVSGTPANSGPLTDANISSVASNGWTILYNNPPVEFDPVGDSRYIVVSDTGFNESGATVAVQRELRMMKRTRTPGATSPLTVNEVAAEDVVYASTSLVGTSAINNSTRAYPKPLAMWVTKDMGIIRSGDTSWPARLCVSHPHGGNGKPVACVEFRLTDGVTTNSSVVSTMSSKQYAASGLYGAYFEVDLVPMLSGLATGGQLVLDAIIKPWVGDSFTISTDADSYPSPNLTTLKVVNDSDGSYGEAYVFVDPAAGDDGTGSASATFATAQANPFATLLAAGNALETFNNANYSRNSASGGEIVLADGTYDHSSLGGIATDSSSTVVIRSLSPSNKSSVIYQDPGSSVTSGTPDHSTWKDITLRKQGGSVIFFDSGANLGSMDRTNQFLNCDFDQNGTNGYNAWFYRTGRLYFEDCSGLFGFTANFSTVNKVTNLVGCSGPQSGAAYNMFACQFDDGAFTDQIVQSNRPKGVGQMLAFSHLTQDTNASRVIGFNDAPEERGVAWVMSIAEHTGGTTGPAMQIHADGNTTPILNAQAYGMTVLGTRTNWLYQDTGTAEVTKYGWMIGCVNHDRNTKGDLFPPVEAARTGNWSVMYQVGHRYNATREGSASNDNTGPGSWLGEVSHPSDVNGTNAAPVDFLWADDQSFTAAGSGGGDYTPGELTPLPTIPYSDVHYPIDMKGRAVPTDGTAVAGALQKA